LVGQLGFFDVGDRLRELSAKGDDLERVNPFVDFEMFRPDLERAVPRSDGTKGGRPAFDRVVLLLALHALEDVLDATNTASDVWGNTAYRSVKSEAVHAGRGLVSSIHRKKPQGQPMPERMRQANARKSLMRCKVEQVFAH